MTSRPSVIRGVVFRSGAAVIAADVALYLIAITHIRGSVLDAKSLSHTLHIAAVYFVVGAGTAIVAALLALFGHGWKRLALLLACVATLPFWYGLTAY